MYSNTAAHDMVDDRGPRFAVRGSIRPGESYFSYADTAEQAEKIREHCEASGYYQIRVYPPAGSVDLGKLGRDRAAAQRVLEEKTQVLRAGVLRALEEGRAEAEVARTAGVDRMTVRKWAGK